MENNFKQFDYLFNDFHDKFDNNDELISKKKFTWNLEYSSAPAP